MVASLTARTLAPLPEAVLRRWLGTKSLRTARAYATDVEQFRGWVADQSLDWRALGPGDVQAWIAALRLGECGLEQSPASVGRKLSAVKSFYGFAAEEELVTANPAGPVKAPPVRRDDATGSISRAQARAVWDATADDPRLRTLVAVMLFAGLRVAEAVSLDVADIQEEQGARVLRVRHGKGDKPRTCVLSAAAVHAIQKWLTVRGDHPGPLISTRNGTAMDVRAAHRAISSLGVKVGITGLHPHTLRHTFATRAVDSGAEILRVATALGHASTATTMRYVRGGDTITGSPVHLVTDDILGALAEPS
jgi:integrase/recombinase XerD